MSDRAAQKRQGELIAEGVTRRVPGRGADPWRVGRIVALPQYVRAAGNEAPRNESGEILGSAGPSCNLFARRRN